MFLVMMVTLATHVLIMPSLLVHSVTSPGTILNKKDGLFFPSVKWKILPNLGEMLFLFLLIARNSMCPSPLPDFLMDFRCDDSGDAFDTHNTWNIALLLVNVFDFDAGRHALSCHFAQHHVPDSNGARWRTTDLLTNDALQALFLFSFLLL